jgi:hypothetical protein
MYRISVVLLSVALVLPASAANKFDAEARARAVAPFIDVQTVSVAHIDLTRIDADAILDWAIEVGQLDKNEIEGPRRVVRGWLTDLTKAGGKELYVVISLTDIPMEPPLVVVPLEAGADAESVRRVLNRVKAFEQLRFETMEQAVIGGSEDARKRLRSAKPAARPELSKAFAAAGDTTAQLLLLPTPDTRRIINELIPALPPEAGGGSTRPFTHGLLWAAVGVDLPPKLSVRLSIQSADEKAARLLSAFLERLVKSLAQLREVRDFLPGIGRLAEGFTLQAEGDRLTLSGNDKEWMAFMQTVVKRIYQTAHRGKVESRLHQLVLAMHNYSDTYKGQMPAIANFDKQGKPLLSWRVHLLPYVGEQKLYKEFHLDEPWDSPHNKKLLERMPSVYQGPNRKLNADGKTIFLVPVGKEVAFTGGPERRLFPKDFPDGTSNTILIVEADDSYAVPWTKPEDLKIDLEHPERGLGGHFHDGFVLGIADGSTHFVKKTVSKATLRYAFTIAGGDTLGPDW